MRLLALDPGGTTGWARYIKGEPSNTPIAMGQIGGRPHHSALWNMLHTYNPDVVICERFMYQRRDLTKGVTLNIDAREYIGIARLYCDLRRTQYIEQTPAQAKNLFTDAKLKKLDLYSTSAPHANDATRHLLYYLVVTLGQREWLDPLKP